MTQRHILPPSQLPPAVPQPRGGSRPYRRGSDAERSLLKQFGKDGAIAIRSAGSAGPFDLAVVLPGGGRLLQVKLCSASPTEGQIARWLDAMRAVPDGWSAELWVRCPRGWRSYRAPPDAPVRGGDVIVQEQAHGT